MTTFEVTTDDGVRLAGERWAGRPGAPVVLAIHGITANRLAFLPLARAFAGDVDLVSFDCRGRGLSDKPSEPTSYGMRRHADDAAAVLRSLGVSDVVVVGQSMGAWVGEQLAAHHPSLVRGLVFGDGGYFTALAPGETAAERVAGIMGPAWLDRLRMTFPSAEVVLGAFRGLWSSWWTDDVETLLREGLVEAEGGVRSRAYDLGAEHDSVDYFRGEPVPYVVADLARVTCPAHLVRAEYGFALSPETMEPMMPMAVVEEFQAALPQLTVETVPGTSHYSVNFGAEGVAAIADAVRKML